MASLVAVATVLLPYGLNIYILQSEQGGLIRKTKLPMQELEPIMQGGLIREGGAYLRDSTVHVHVQQQ
jgi:hypothetical protein